MNGRCIFIGGPTGGGKTSLALALAERIDGRIVNTDASQNYSDLRLLSARPTPEEEARAPHHLFGWLDGAERCSVGRWARAVEGLMIELADDPRPCIFVGGTGLYFRALEQGLSEIPAVAEEIREAGRARRDAIGPDAFHREVVACDPEMARLHPNDAQRLIRAWSVYEQAGEPLSSFQTAARPVLESVALRLVLEPPRNLLYEACDRRFTEMLTNGAVEEVERLTARKLEADLPVMKAIGVREIAAWLAGEIDREEMIARAQRETRRYAKRQSTWFRGQSDGWLKADGAAEGLKQLLARWTDLR